MPSFFQVKTSLWVLLKVQTCLSDTKDGWKLKFWLLEEEGFYYFTCKKAKAMNTKKLLQGTVALIFFRS